jgi:hypothetical protein
MADKQLTQVDDISINNVYIILEDGNGLYDS